MAFLTAVAGAGGSLLSGLGTVVGIAGTIFSGIAQYQAGKYQQKVAEMNAKIAEENANRTNLASEQEQLQQDRAAAGLLGEMEAGQSASGLSIEGGSFSAARRSARKLARLDALNIRQAGAVEAYGYRTDAVNQRAEGQMKKMAGQNALLGSFLDAGSSLISGASSSGSTLFGPRKSSAGINRPGAYWRM